MHALESFDSGPVARLGGEAEGDFAGVPRHHFWAVPSPANFGAVGSNAWPAAERKDFARLGDKESREGSYQFRSIAGSATVCQF